MLYRKNEYIFRLSKLISLLVIILIEVQIIINFFIEVGMYRLIRDGLVGVVFIFSIHILITIIFNWLCFGKLSIWIKNDFKDE